MSKKTAPTAAETVLCKMSRSETRREAPQQAAPRAAEVRAWTALSGAAALARRSPGARPALAWLVTATSAAVRPGLTAAPAPHMGQPLLEQLDAGVPRPFLLRSPAARPRHGRSGRSCRERHSGNLRRCSPRHGTCTAGTASCSGSSNPARVCTHQACRSRGPVPIRGYHRACPGLLCTASRMPNSPRCSLVGGPPLPARQREPLPLGPSRP